MVGIGRRQGASLPRTVALVHLAIDEGPRHPDAAPAPPVVLLHGQPGTAGDWYRVVPLLSGDHRVITVDRPGYAGDPAAARDWAGNVDELAGLLDDLQLPEVVLVASSWAGGVALEMAARKRERLAGIVLLASVGGKGAITWLDRIMALRPTHPIGVGFAQHAGVALATPFSWASGSRLDEQAIREARLALAVWQERHVWETAALEQTFMVRDHPALEARVPALDVPSVVLQGTRDTLLPPKAGAELARALPRARLVELEAGHMLALEEPGAVVSAVRSLTRAERLAPDAASPAPQPAP